MKVIEINDDTVIKLYPTGGVGIEDYFFCDDENGIVFATTDTFRGERFSWVGNFVYRYQIVIDIDPY